MIAECSTGNLPRYLRNGWEQVGTFREELPLASGELVPVTKHLIVLDLLSPRQELLTRQSPLLPVMEVEDFTAHPRVVHG